MTPEQFLSGLKKDIRPKAGLEERIKQKVAKRITTKSPLFTELQEHLTPKAKLRDSIWSNITSRIDLPARDAMAQLKDTLSPSEAFKLKLRTHVLQSLSKLEQVDRQSFAPVTLKWVAAFALFGIFVRMSPMLFVASPTVARTEALLLVTRGEVAVGIDGKWETVDREIALQPGMMLRTHDGEASIVLHDDGVIRLSDRTTFRLDDLSDSLGPPSEISQA